MQSFEFEIDNWDGKSELDIERPDYVVTQATIEFGISPIVYGRMYLSNGDPGYPDEGGDLEHFEVFNETGDNITDTIPERWIEILQEQCHLKNDL